MLVVDDVTRALQRIAASHRLSYDLPVIAVTGSRGQNHGQRVALPVAEHRHERSAQPAQLQFADRGAAVVVAA